MIRGAEWADQACRKRGLLGRERRKKRFWRTDSGFGLVPGDFLGGIWLQEHYCVAGFFYFQILRWVLLLSETFLGEISGLSRRTGGSALFTSCRVAALQSSGTLRAG